MPEAPELVKELVEKFENNLSAYKNSDYKEEQLKQEFINPLFQALGWDVDNRSGAAPQYRDVIFEDSIKVGGGTKAPDYCFTLAGKRMFFVEAKKPAVNVDRDKRFSYQLRRYAWSAKLPLSILTDFEEFAVYESRTRPKKDEKASTGRILYFTYKDYVEKWDEIYNIFSKDAILKGSFDRYAESTKKKRGTSEVDDAFLSEIENWRELFARNIALRNPEISIEELNFSVQKIIDRLIFLRMCEDRGAEPYEQLRDLIGKKDIYLNFCELCKKADEKYNSGLFHFQEEKGRKTSPDELTLNLKIDDRIFKTIINDIYYPNSPYEFSVLSPEILGNVYEQFLGKVIRLTKGHQAKVEEKPEVKKAGGVYYTPQFVVDYIVKNTIGELCKGKTPNKVSKLKILDPSCGSGSFLLGAYTYLLKWHRDYYTEQKDKNRLKDKIYQGKGGEWFLTIKEKKRILLNNIHGVDIDNQAVEVTKLSLLLKVLEGENKDALEAQQKLFKERALPDLGNNIKCGNSLIGNDVYNFVELNSENMKRINPFEWEIEFPQIMNNGGFDAIIGNPPWGASFSDLELKYLRVKHENIIIRMIDSYMYFIHHSTKIMDLEGVFGMIIPSTMLTQSDLKALRIFLAKKFNLHVVVNLGDKIFGPKVLNTSTILIFSSKKAQNPKEIKIGDLRHLNIDEKPKELNNLKSVKYNTWMNTILADPDNTFFTLNLQGVNLFQSISKKLPKLKDIVNGKIQRGISPDYKDAFVIEEETAIQKNIEKEILRPVLLGENISRYNLIKPSKFIIYLTRDDNINDYPNTKRFLTKYRDKITCREVQEKKHPWYSLHRPRKPEIFNSPKIVGLTTTKEICVCADIENNYYVTDALYLFKIRSDFKIKELFVMGVLQSKIFKFLYKMSSQGEQRVIPQIKATKLQELPFPIIDITEPKSKIKHEHIVDLVKNMIQLNQKLSKIKIPNEKELIQRQIDATDKQIDNLVYELYDLTDDEIKIVEDSLK